MEEMVNKEDIIVRLMEKLHWLLVLVKKGKQFQMSRIFLFMINFMMDDISG